MAEVVFVRNAEFKLATSRNLEIAVWYDAPSAAQLEVLAQTARSLRQSHPAGIALLNVVQGGGMPNFADDARAAVQQLNRDANDDLGVAHLVLVGGLVAAATRAFISTTALVSRTKMPVRTFGEPRAAALWLGALLASRDRMWSADEVMDAYGKTMGGSRS
jgi:hypothetical protein